MCFWGVATCPCGVAVVFQSDLPLDFSWALGPILSLVPPSRNGSGRHLCLYVVINEGGGGQTFSNSNVKRREWC